MSSFHLISRLSPIDDFCVELFSRCLEKFNCEYDAFYVHVSFDFEKNLKLIEQSLTKNLIIICIKDNLEISSHGYWIDRQPQAGSVLLQNFLQKHIDHRFIILSTLENLDAEIQAPNADFITIIGEGLDQRNLYRNMESCKVKNMDSKYVYLNLNRHNRLHRVTTLSYLFGRDLDRYGLISCICTGPKEDFHHPMMHSDIDDEIKNILAKGLDRLYQTKFDRTYNIYEQHSNNYFLNFNKKLRPKYQEVFVDIVSETMFSSPAYLVTEKTFHCMYGYCFPIILNSTGAIAHMREIGFDMFDDVIDHSYDTVTNSVQRIVMAIDNNRKILTDLDYVKNLWQTNFYRFEHNAEIARNGAEKFYVQRFENRLDALIKNYQNH